MMRVIEERMMADLQRRLADLLIDPQESPEVELKGWLDLAGSNEDKATIAKAILALANHGGGFIILGLTESIGGARPSAGAPATLDAYDQDHVNGIVQSYADPAFHCEVRFERSPVGSLHPIIVVPGGHRTPIRAKRGGPNAVTVQTNAIYIRRPGPKSETPQSAQDWDDLLSRCLAARRDELMDRVRDLLEGATRPVSTPTVARLDTWMAENEQRWESLIAKLPPDDARRCPHGSYRFAYELTGDLKLEDGRSFLGILDEAYVRHTGWPPWWVPDRGDIAPYLMDDTVECWLGREGDRWLDDAAHSDFWRVSRRGMAYLLRGYQEDAGAASERTKLPPRQAFDITLPIWRIGEALLHAEQLAGLIMDGDATVTFRAQYKGLAGRRLVHLEGTRNVGRGRSAHQNDIQLETTVDAASVSSALPEIVGKITAPLYALFGFTTMPPTVIREELNRLRSNRF